ncbi:MAG: DUF2807 domain-containing protein [Bacteroidales bacterium]|nr:DUF2807 domain-containing protein [Bacteroidales bacterium]
MKRIFIIFTLALASAAMSAQQKQVVINHDYMGFSGIEANDNFEINVVCSDSHSIKVTANSSIEEYVQAYVKNGVLYLNIDEKAMPSELKKEFKAKNSVISTVKAEVSMLMLKSLTINGTSVVNVADTLAMDKLYVKLSKTALVKNLNVNASVSAVIDVAGKSQAFMAVKAPALEIVATNSAKADLNVEAERLTVSAGSFAKVELFGKASRISLTNEGNAKVEYNTK